jgi:hypothetical protein
MGRKMLGLAAVPNPAQYLKQAEINDARENSSQTATDKMLSAYFFRAFGGMINFQKDKIFSIVNRLINYAAGGHVVE